MTTHLVDEASHDSGAEPQRTTVLDVVIPVFNEEETLASSVRAVYLHLKEQFAYPFRITIADNASSDATLAVAHGMER